MGYNCRFCNKSFVRETTLITHACERRKRFHARDEKPVRVALSAYQQFWKTTYRKSKVPTFDEFEESRLYGGFLKFGRYLCEIDAVHPSLFIDFLLRAGVPLDAWCNAYPYETYMRELNKAESPDAAVERNILLMQAWEREDPDNRHWANFFREISPPLAITWIRAGRISPWVLFSARSGGDLLDRMSDNQLNLIKEAIDPAFWDIKLKQHSDEVEKLRAILQEAGI